MLFVRRLPGRFVSVSTASVLSFGAILHGFAPAGSQWGFTEGSSWTGRILSWSAGGTLAGKSRWVDPLSSCCHLGHFGSRQAKSGCWSFDPGGCCSQPVRNAEKGFCKKQTNNKTKTFWGLAVHWGGKSIYFYFIYLEYVRKINKVMQKSK